MKQHMDIDIAVKLEDVSCPFAPGLTHKVVGILLKDAIVAVGIGHA